MSAGNNSKYSRYFKRISCCLILFFVISLPKITNAYELLLGTGEQDSFSHFVGRAVCRIIRTQSDFSCKVVPSVESSHNLTNLRSGSLDLALVDSRILHDAFNNSGYFRFLDITYENLRTLLPLYSVPIALVARKDAKIKSLDELKGKRFNAGAPLSLQRFAADNIMDAKGWNKRDFNPFSELSANHAQDTLALNNGTIQAMLSIGVQPDPALAHLLARSKAMLVDMNDADMKKLVESRSGFFFNSIPAGTYRTNPDQVVTIATKMVLVTSEDMDDGTVVDIVDAILKKRDQLRKIHPALFLPGKLESVGQPGEVQPHPAVAEDL